MQPDERRRVVPHTITTSYGLPPDVVDTAVRRVGFLGLVCAATFPVALLTEHFTQPGRVNLPGQVPFPHLVVVTLSVIGLAVCVLAWSRKIEPGLMLDLGLVFQVVVALGISLHENAKAWPPQQEIRGISWNCLWISMYVVAVPGTFGKTVLAAIASALMAPVGLLVATVANNNDMPAANQLLVLLLPPFAAAAWSIPAARYMYRLGAQVSKAREMGSYQLLELIGKGGMGEVWRAQHRMLARASAIKLIRPEVLGAEGGENARVLLHRFQREARATAALRSPHTVDLYDYGSSDDGSFYYVMELLEGVDLENLVLRFGPQPAGRVICLLQQACKSLAEAHEHGLIHRDVKPRNIFTCHLGTDYDFVKVLDFGLVKIGARDDETQTQLTREGVTTGTPAYMAPEVAAGSAQIDGRADLYSLGCVGYWLLTGQLVFESKSAMAMVMAHVQTPPTPPSQRTELEIPETLERVILACLEKDPGKRPQDALELSRQLAASGAAGTWTQQDAERWWRAHMPRQEEHRAAKAAAETETV